MKKTVGSGDRVTILLNHHQQSFRLVNEGHGDPRVGRLSVQSPLGTSLIGRALGDSFYYTGPHATMFEVEILQID